MRIAPDEFSWNNFDIFLASIKTHIYIVLIL